MAAVTQLAAALRNSAFAARIQMAAILILLVKFINLNDVDRYFSLFICIRLVVVGWVEVNGNGLESTGSSRNWRKATESSRDRRSAVAGQGKGTGCSGKRREQSD